MDSGKQSFTLLEVVLALTIFAVIATLAGSILFSSQQGWSIVRESTSELDRNLRLDRLVDTAFRNTVPFYWPDENNRNMQIFCGKPAFLRLAYLHRVNDPDEGGIRFLELFQEEYNLIARYRSYPILVDHDNECEQEIIAEDVHRLTFSYAFRENGKILWQPEFDAVAAETIPLAIRMDVEFANGERLSFLRRTAGNSANSSYGKFRKNTYAK